MEEGEFIKWVMLNLEVEIKKAEWLVRKYINVGTNFIHHVKGGASEKLNLEE